MARAHSVVDAAGASADRGRDHRARRYRGRHRSHRRGQHRAGLRHAASIDHAFAPPPPYPPIALRHGAEGAVWLRIEVDASG
ncbi:MAG: hypothetical protein CO182_07050, partial [Lysobacterales bacterium CG_4_9_14_3_um_filter_62_6]